MRYLKHIFNLSSLIITLVTAGILGLLSVFPIDLDILNPLEDAFSDFELTDMYYSSSTELREIPPGDDRVVLVNIGNLDRVGIALLIETINKYKPKVIGIDAFFKEERVFEEDSILAASLSQVDNLVLVSRLPPEKYDVKANKFDSLGTSAPVFMKSVKHTGYANLITKGKGQDEFVTFRTFAPFQKVKDGTELAFAVKLAQIYDAKKAQKILDRKNKVEYINYIGNLEQFTVLDINQVLNEDFDPRAIEGKIVILGFLGPNLDVVAYVDRGYSPLNDKYIGRTSPDMYGAVVHANIVSMILNESYIDVMPTIWNIVLGMVICYFTVALFSFVYIKAGFWYDGITLIFQFIISIFVLYALIIAFESYRIKIDFVFMVFSIILSGFLVEIYYGLFAKIYNKTFKKDSETKTEIITEQKQE